MTAMDTLKNLRSRLDRIDRQLLDNLHDRIRCCVEIAAFKRENDVPMMQPHRIEIVRRRAAEYGRAHGIDETFLLCLYDLIIEETCRVEDLVIGATNVS